MAKQAPVVNIFSNELLPLAELLLFVCRGQFRDASFAAFSCAGFFRSFFVFGDLDDLVEDRLGNCDLVTVFFRGRFRHETILSFREGR